MFDQGLDRAGREPEDHRKAHVGRADQLRQGRFDQEREVAAAVLSRKPHGVPTGFGGHLVGLTPTVGEGDLVVLPAGPFDVAKLVEGRNHLGHELAALVEQRLHGGRISGFVSLQL